MSAPDEVVGMIQEIEKGKVPVMVKICSGEATDEEIDQWMVEQQIPQDEKDQVLSMLTNSFSTGGMLAERMHQYEEKPEPLPYDNIGNIEDTEEHKFPGSSQTDIINRLKLVLSEIDTIRSQVTTLMEQVSLLK